MMKRAEKTKTVWLPIFSATSDKPDYVRLEVPDWVPLPVWLAFASRRVSAFRRLKWRVKDAIGCVGKILIRWSGLEDDEYPDD